MIEVQNLTKKYGETIAVDNINFSVNKGEIVGFLGPNGAGKTTTMRIITCYLPCDAGTAKVGGFDIHQHPIEVRRRIGYLPENAPLYKDMGVIEYLRFIAEIRGLESTLARQRMDEMIETCGLKEVLHKDVGELSKGYRQRLGLAQTLIHDPQILILDEPTSGLDPNQIIEIRNLIKKIGKEKTVILSTHILPEVSATCDRTIIINRGKITAEGTTEDLAAMIEGKDIYWVCIKGQRNQVKESLQQIKGVESVKITDVDENEYVRYRLECSRNMDLGEEIFKLVVANQWMMNELSKEQISLEEAFVKLTTSAESPTS